MFSSLEEFEHWFAENRDPSTVFLIDYEFLNQPENGIQVVERLGIAPQSILVTSRYDEIAIREKAGEMKLKILPKNLAAYIPIEDQASPT
jgi:hypothetical protein